MIKNVKISTPASLKPTNHSKPHKNLSFCADKSNETEKSGSSRVRKLAKAITVVAVLALPLVLLKIPPEKMGPFKGVQEKINTFIETKVQPLISKAFAKKVPQGNPGLNIVR